MEKSKKKLLLIIGIVVAIVVCFVAVAVVAMFLYLKVLDAGKTAVYAPGEYTEIGYESEVVGFRFTTPEGCTLATEEELAELIGMSHELLGDSYEDWKMYYAEQATVYDMMALMPSGANVNVIWARTEGVGDEQEMVDQIKQELETLDFMDVKVQEGYEKVEIAGREYVKMVAETTMNGVEMIQEFYVCAENGYSINMTLTYFEGYESEREALINAFEEK